MEAPPLPCEGDSRPWLLRRLWARLRRKGDDAASVKDQEAETFAGNAGAWDEAVPLSSGARGSYSPFDSERIEVLEAPPVIQSAHDDAPNVRAIRWTIIGLAGSAAFLLALIVTVLAGRYSRAVLAERLLPDSRRTDDELIYRLQCSLSPAVRLAAAKELSTRGQATVNRTLLLVTEGADDTVYSMDPAVLETFLQMGPELVDSLKMSLMDDSARVRVGAAYVLRELGPSASGAIIQLGYALRDKNVWVRRIAAETIGNCGDKVAPAMSRLVMALKDEDVIVRRRAAVAMGKLGPRAREGVVELVEMTTDEPDAEAKRLAQLALYEVNLESIASQAATTASDEVRQHLNLLQSGNIDQRRAAAKALGAGRTVSKVNAAPGLVLALRDADPQVRAAAAESLSNLGAKDPWVIIALERLANDPHSDVRSAARAALSALQVNSAAANNT